MNSDGQSGNVMVGNVQDIQDSAKRLTGKFIFRLPPDSIVHTISVEANDTPVGTWEIAIVIAQGVTSISHKIPMTLPDGSEHECLVTITTP